jgi:hypothetical protein
MVDWLEFGRGPLFRFCFALMLLGLARLAVLAAIRARNGENGPDSPPIEPGWAQPAFRSPFWRWLRVAALVVFHAGLILLALFVAAHVFAWRRAVGFAWFALPKEISDRLAVLTVISGAVLFLMSAVERARHPSPARRPVWLLVLLAPVATGYLAANIALQPDSYRTLMLFHVYSGDLIVAAIPFTRVADCVLRPLARSVTRSPWRPLAEILALSVVFEHRPAVPQAVTSREEA